ncbi:hypothetical protein [Streptomyces sp. NPDC020996]|uniref:hypothetical protein n=1 Tax=Streptomyces sp. NPDC020996 TaxID=3154791 RepID=UPI0034002971
MVFELSDQRVEAEWLHAYPSGRRQVAKNGLRPTEVVNLVIQVASDPADEKWALFDRDAQDNRDQDIPDAMRKAAEQGVQVALSPAG